MSQFIQRLKQRVAKDMRNIVLPEGDSRRVLQAAEQVAVEGFARPILVGKEGIIKRNAALYAIDLSGVRIVDPETSPDLKGCSAYFAKRRAKSGMTLSKARDILCQNPVFFGAALVALDKADGDGCRGHSYVGRCHSGGFTGHWRSSGHPYGEQFFYYDYSGETIWRPRYICLRRC